MTDTEHRGPNATGDALAGTHWRMLTIDDRAVVEDGEPLVISFDHDGRVAGSTGVNRLTASYSLTAEYLTIGPIATTRRAGTPELMEQEHRVTAALAGMCPFRLDALNLSLDGPMGRVDLVNLHPPAVATDLDPATDPSRTAPPAGPGSPPWSSAQGGEGHGEGPEGERLGGAAR